MGGRIQRYLEVIINPIQMLVCDESVPKTIDNLEHRRNVDFFLLIYNYIRGMRSTEIKEICPPIMSFSMITTLSQHSLPLVLELPVYRATYYSDSSFSNHAACFWNNLPAVFLPFVPDAFTFERTWTLFLSSILLYLCLFLTTISYAYATFSSAWSYTKKKI